MVSAGRPASGVGSRFYHYFSEGTKCILGRFFLGMRRTRVGRVKP